MAKAYLFATSSNPQLTQLLVSNSSLELGSYTLSRFADGEILFELRQDVKKQEVFVLGSSYPPAEHLIELFTIINTLKLNGATTINVITPYLGYAKSDHPDRPNQPINSRLFAQFLEKAGADHVITFDPHGHNIINFFTVPFTRLSAIPIFATYLQPKIQPKKTAVITPDLGGKKRAEDLATLLNIDDIIVVEKNRPTYDQAVVTRITGDPKGKDLIIIDDLIQTGNTLVNAAQTLKNQGANKIYAVVTHFVYPAKALEKVTSPIFTEFITTNSIPAPKDSQLPENFKVLSLSDTLTKTIDSILE